VRTEELKKGIEEDGADGYEAEVPDEHLAETITYLLT